MLDDVKKYGEEIIKQLQNNSSVREIYDPDVAMYISTWEMREGDYQISLINSWRRG